MITPRNGPPRPKGRPGPKPRGRTVIPPTITVTHVQRTALDARAEMHGISISAVVRAFIVVGLAPDGEIIP